MLPESETSRLHGGLVSLGFWVSVRAVLRPSRRNREARLPRGNNVCIKGIFPCSPIVDLGAYYSTLEYSLYLRDAQAAHEVCAKSSELTCQIVDSVIEPAE